MLSLSGRHGVYADITDLIKVGAEVDIFAKMSHITWSHNVKLNAHVGANFDEDRSPTKGAGYGL